MYCHIGSLRGRIPMQVQVGRLGNEGGVGGAGHFEEKQHFQSQISCLLYVVCYTFIYC